MKKNEGFYYFYGKKDLLKSMRLLFILMTMTGVAIPASSFSQRQQVTLEVKDVGAMELFKEIQRKTSLYFVYNNTDLSAYDHISVSAKNENVDVLLKRVFSGLEFLFEGNVIVVKPVSMKDDEKKEVKRYVIKGKVVDEKNQPLPGVTVRLDSTMIGCATNEKGMFELMLPVEKGQLIFSFVGFKQEKKSFRAGSEVIVRLKEETSDLDEVTVVAYGERRKREVIGAISSVKADDIKEIPTASLESLLQGRMAGVEINTQSGAPGGGGSVVAIRGYNSLFVGDGRDYGEPLYVIDGVPVHSFTSPVTGTNALAEIDPSTIESVEVLKDAASAAIYGSRAGNGVILITTKKGRAGRASFSANVSYTYSILPETPVQTGGRSERAFVFDAMKNERMAGYYSGEYIFPTGYDEGKAGRGLYDRWWYNAMNNITGQRVLQDSLNPYYNNVSSK